MKAFPVNPIFQPTLPRLQRGLVLFLFSGVGISIFAGQVLQDPFTDDGEIVRTHLASSPFPHPKRAGGHVYGNTTFPSEKHYSDSSVILYLPKGLNKQDAVDLVIHFHGWYNNIDTTVERYQLIRQFAESGKNAVLVVPEGPRNAPDSFGGKLEDPDGFSRFVSEIIDTLFFRSKVSTRRVGNIILSGHSGAYHVISFILMRGGLKDRIKEVFLFDALYGQTEKFVYWLDHTEGKLVDIYTDSGGTKSESENLMADLEGWNIPFLSKEDTAVTPDELHSQRLIFLHTDLTHDEVMHRRLMFGALLKASMLHNR